MKMKTAFLAAAALSLAAPALAHGHRGHMNADADGDGNVTLAEMRAQVAEHFGKMDLDGNGQVTKAEREQLHAQRVEAMKARMAANGKTFDEERFKARAEKRKARMEARGGERRMKGPDANGDGVVTLAEMEAKALERFQRVDANGDGVMSKDERDAMRAKWHEMRKERRGESRG